MRDPKLNIKVFDGSGRVVAISACYSWHQGFKTNHICTTQLYAIHRHSTKKVFESTAPPQHNKDTAKPFPMWIRWAALLHACTAFALSLSMCLRNTQDIYTSQKILLESINEEKMLLKVHGQKKSCLNKIISWCHVITCICIVHSKNNYTRFVIEIVHFSFYNLYCATSHSYFIYYMCVYSS